MDNDRLILFIKKLIEKTKRGKLAWRKEIYQNKNADYICEFFNGNIVKIRCAFLTGLLTVSITYTEESTEDFPIYSDDEAYASLLRLYNIIYNLFPNPEKAIDDFINS